MVSLWKLPKQPMMIIKAFKKFVDSHPNAKLIIGGYGPLWQEMIDTVHSYNLDHYVDFIGKLDSDQIASEMNKASAFIHISDYETFSVVCAEALCCGTPVIASAVGGIPEFIEDGKNGILINHNSDKEDSQSISKSR